MKGCRRRMRRKERSLFGHVTRLSDVMTLLVTITPGVNNMSRREADERMRRLWTRTEFETRIQPRLQDPDLTLQGDDQSGVKRGNDGVYPELKVYRRRRKPESQVRGFTPTDDREITVKQEDQDQGTEIHDQRRIKEENPDPRFSVKDFMYIRGKRVKLGRFFNVRDLVYTGVRDESQDPDLIDQAYCKVIIGEENPGPWTPDGAGPSEQGGVGPQLHSCPECEETFESADSLKLHEESHVTRYPCGQCGVAFLTPDNLKIHRCIVSFRCEECGKVMHCKKYLKIHKHDHVRQKPSPCPQCGETCRSRRDVKHHQRVHAPHNEPPAHTAGRLFACCQCGKRYTRQRSLRVHQRIHAEGQ